MNITYVRIVILRDHIFFGISDGISLNLKVKRAPDVAKVRPLRHGRAAEQVEVSLQACAVGVEQRRPGQGGWCYQSKQIISVSRLTHATSVRTGYYSSSKNRQR
jgi:hypothetical protein